MAIQVDEDSNPSLADLSRGFDPTEVSQLDKLFARARNVRALLRAVVRARAKQTARVWPSSF